MSNVHRLNVIAWHAVQGDVRPNVLKLANDADPMSLVERLAEIERIELYFPHFTDGRAYSQAYLLRRRLGFTGDLRATGDVQLELLVKLGNAQLHLFNQPPREGLGLGDGQLAELGSGARDRSSPKGTAIEILIRRGRFRTF